MQYRGDVFSLICSPHRDVKRSFKKITKITKQKINAAIQSELPKLAILEKELNGPEQKQNSETSNSYCFFLNFISYKKYLNKKKFFRGKKCE